MLLSGVAVLVLNGAINKLNAEESTTNDPLANWEVVSLTELAELRGGFVTSLGREISIGIERAVVVNGEAQLTYTANFADYSGNMSNHGNSAEDMVSIVQIGENNIVTEDVMHALSGGFSTLLQNSLDNQVIKNITTFNVELRDHGINQSSQLGDLINYQIVQSLR